MPAATKIALATGAVLAAGAGALGLVRARHRHEAARHIGSHWVLTTCPTRGRTDRDSRPTGDAAPSTHDEGSSGSGRSDALLHIGTDGRVAWVIHGGWPTEAVEAAVVDLASVAGSAGLRDAGTGLVGRLGPSPDGEATVMLLLSPVDRSEAMAGLLGVGRGQVAVRNSDGSTLLSCPIETELESGSSLLVRLGDGATEVRVDPISAGSDRGARA